jgi:hypothetical protein
MDNHENPFGPTNAQACSDKLDFGVAGFSRLLISPFELPDLDIYLSKYLPSFFDEAVRSKCQRNFLSTRISRLSKDC